MDQIIILPLIQTLQTFPAEIASLILFITCITAMLLLFKLFGKQGLYTYNIVAILAANIQILKGMQLIFNKDPVALGTVVFATTYLCSGILAEHYDNDAAKQSIWLCFAAQILLTLLMIIAIGHKPITSDITKPGLEHMILADQAINVIFLPSPRLLLASMVAFVIAQLTGISLFQFIKNICTKKCLWLRTILLIIISTIIDTFIFNFLAWNILSPTPARFSIIFSTYIIWTLITQALITILSTPMIYVSYYCKPKSKIKI